MTTKQAVSKALQWGALLIPALGGAWSVAKMVGATKLDVTVYQLDRRSDSLTHYFEQREVRSAILRTDSSLTEIKTCLRTKVCP